MHYVVTLTILRNRGTLEDFDVPVPITTERPERRRLINSSISSDV